MDHMIGVAPALESPITLQRRLAVLSQDVAPDSTTSCDDECFGNDAEEQESTMFLPATDDPEHHRPSLESTASQRRAQMELYDYAQRRLSRRSIVDLRGQRQPAILPGDTDGDFLTVPGAEETTEVQFHDTGYGSIEFEENSSLLSDVDGRLEVISHKPAPRRREWQDSFSAAVGQVPAVTVVALLWLMMALPFGVAYFPIGWSSDDATIVDDVDGMKGAIHGPFPLPGKEALGIRMCLLATIIGQIVMTYTSRFTNPIAFQLLENVPFYHSLANIVIQDLGYGIEALSNLFFLFGLSSLLVGSMFYLLGRFKLGRVVYFFPSHVLVGCIGGIGIFICVTAVSVTNNEDMTFDMQGLQSFLNNLHLFGIVIGLELFLRLLMWLLQDKKGKPRFPLLAPVYFCLIVPTFYLALSAIGIDVATAKEIGLFFPSPADNNCIATDKDCAGSSFLDSVFDGHVLDVFRVLDLRLIAWSTVLRSLGTIAAMASFSLIHVPINIPAFAVSSNVDADMNAELLAHGYANFASGLVGGLQTIMTYSFSVLYMRSGGGGRLSLLAVTAVGVGLFVFGPQVATYIPRCMAGTMLLHIGVDLTLEGIVDSWGSYDVLEYSGILLIAFVMTVFGMTAALVAGIIAALSTYAVQSITNLNPVFRILSASTLRSSAWNRQHAANDLLASPTTGRARVLIAQLQGHLFFGNVATLTDTIKHELNSRKGGDDEPIVVIVDFTLVVGMDSSAAHAVAKLKGIMHQVFNVEVTIFVSGCHRESFPCDYALADALSAEIESTVVDFSDAVAASDDTSKPHHGAISFTPGSKSMEASQQLRSYPKNRVCSSLDQALEFAEDVLIARVDPLLLKRNKLVRAVELSETDASRDDELIVASLALENLAAASPIPPNEVRKAVEAILALCVREEFTEQEIIWTQGSFSDSMKILVNGTLLANLEGTDVTERIAAGSTIGELGLVQGSRRLSTVRCISRRAIAYSLGKSSWDSLVQHNPSAARVVDQIVICYLLQRVQHVSNRIFETRCLPI